MARLATQVMLGKTLGELGVEKRSVAHFGVKEAVFPFNMYPEVDPVLGPEMRSTGEVLGMADDFALAFFKAQQATKSPLPTEGTVLMSVTDRDKAGALEVARRLRASGFSIVATEGTAQFLVENDVPAVRVKKIHEGRPNIADAITNGEIQLVINTPIGKYSKHDDSYIRRAAIREKVPYVTTITAALITAKGIEAYRKRGSDVQSLQSYHEAIR
jgi:carbamoyl-phosphate synthase large subunit